EATQFFEAESSGCRPRQVRLDDAEYFSLTGLPKIQISASLFTNLWIVSVTRYQGLKLTERFDLMFHYHRIEITDQIGHDARVFKPAQSGDLLQVRGELTGLAGFRNEAVSDENHDCSFGPNHIRL